MTLTHILLYGLERLLLILTDSWHLTVSDQHERQRRRLWRAICDKRRFNWRGIAHQRRRSMGLIAAMGSLRSLTLCSMFAPQCDHLQNRPRGGAFRLFRQLARDRRTVLCRDREHATAGRLARWSAQRLLDGTPTGMAHLLDVDASEDR